MTVHKRKRKAVLDQTMHPVEVSASSSWDVASVDLCSSALVTSSDQRTPSRALPTEAPKTSTAHLQEHRKCAPLFNAGFGPDSRSWTLQAPQSAKRDFHDVFTNPFQKLSLRENNDNTSTNICSTIRKIQSCLEIQDNPKATQQTFYQFAPDQHFDNQGMNIFSTVCDYFGLNCIFGTSKRTANFTQNRSWETIEHLSLEICSAVRYTSRLKKFLDVDTYRTSCSDTIFNSSAFRKILPSGSRMRRNAGSVSALQDVLRRAIILGLSLPPPSQRAPVTLTLGLQSVSPPRRLITVNLLADLFHDLWFKKVDNVLPCAL